ncbi:MAG: GldG family protein [Verrucomicrobiia bacterium]
MKNRNIETLLYSTIGVVAMLVLLIVINFILGAWRLRFDLTEEKAYTLSDGTKKILSKLDTPVKIRFYFSRGEETPVFLKNYAQRVEDLLAEFRQASRGKITIEKYDPQPDTDAEDAAIADGIDPQPLTPTVSVRFGLAVSCLDQKVAIPYLAPERERLLEYDIARAISRVVNPERPVIGIMSALPVFGQQSSPFMPRPGQQQQEPWLFVSELQRDFTVRKVDMDTDKIDDDIRLLLVVHPKNISEKAQFAIDQFVLRGGKLIVCIDPVSVMDSQSNPMAGGMQQPSSTLDKLLKAWGLDMDTSKVIVDMQCRSPRYHPKVAHLVTALSRPNMKQDEVFFAQLDNLLFPFAGAITGTPVEGLKMDVLLKSSTDSELVDGFMARLSSEQVAKEFKASGKEYNIAVRLTGKFKTAFPNGKPEDSKSEEDKDKKDSKPKEEYLKESQKENTVYIFADSDWLHDQFSVDVQSIFGQKIMIPHSGNLSLAQNLVELLSGDENLINSRSRATVNRPFTRVRDIQAKAEARFLEEVKKLEEERANVQRRINELQSKKEGNQRFILSPEQKAELKKLREAEAQTAKKLKEVRKELRKEVDSLETRVKWLNIAGMPLLVAVFGLGVALYNQKQRAAK